MCECSSCGESCDNRVETPAVEEVKNPIKPEITFDDFMKVDLRVGKILEVSEHPNADKLLVIKVDIGSEVRTICAGVKAWYAPEQLIGRNIIVVANLAPRKLRGVESHGMLVAASDDDHSNVVVLTTEKDSIEPGCTCS